VDAHVKAEHENTVYPCPYKEEDGCKVKDFKQKRSLNDHIAKKHQGKEGKSYKCPECEKKYTQSHNLAKHVKATHRGERLPCPYKEEHGCEVDFATPDGVKQHVRAFHETHKGERLPRPDKEENESKVDFTTPDGVKQHTKAIHKDRSRFPCRATGCTKTFKRKDYATGHYKRVHVNGPLPYSCKICGQKFQFLPSKNTHEKNHTQHECPRNACYERFNSIEEALKHAGDAQHRSDQQLYGCPINNCRLTVLGKVLDKPSLEKHWNMHIKQEHIPDDLKLILKDAKQPPFRDIPLFGLILANNHSIKLASASLDNAVPDPDEAAEEDGGGGDEEEDEIFIIDDKDINILEQNKEWWGMYALVIALDEN
jgi:transcription elongation factor Elf1